MKDIKLLVFLLAMLLFNNYLLAQQYTVPLWNKEIPNNRNTIENEEVVYSWLTVISNVQVPEIKIFLPTKLNATGQSLIICPGGGYDGLAYDWEGLDYAKYLNSIGVTGIVLKYRLPNSKNNIIGYKSPLMDIQRAIRISRFNAAKWNIDPDKIGVMGSSAGGHLASTAGTCFDYGNPDAKDSIDRMSCRPDFMILIYPVISFTDSCMHRGSRDMLLGENPDPKLCIDFSNELQVKDNTPPAFIIHADDDDGVRVENSLLFYAALRKHKIPAELHIYSEGGHDFALGVNKGHYEFWTQACHEWLKWLDKKYKKVQNS